MRASTEGAIEIRRRIAARPETVFSYFTDPERYRRWQGVDAELDPRPGGIFRVTMTGRSRTVASGEYVTIEPPTRVVFTWGWEPIDRFPEYLDRGAFRRDSGRLQRRAAGNLDRRGGPGGRR